MIKIVVTTLVLAVAPWTSSAATFDFGVLPSRYFGTADAPYGCQKDATCRIPDPEQLERVLREFIQDAPQRLAMLENLVDRYAEIESSMKTLAARASASGKNHTAQYYGEVAALIIPALETRLERLIREPNAKLGTIRTFLGTQSVFIAGIQELKTVIVTWNNRINEERDEAIRDAFRLKLQSDYFRLTQGSSIIGRGLWQMRNLAEYLAKDAEELTALDWCGTECERVQNIARFLEFNGCETQRGLLREAQAQFGVKFVSDRYRPSLLIAEDAQLIMNLLDGPDGKPLSIRCRKTRLSSLRTKYDGESHTLDYPWFRGFELCIPGNCGDFDFHYSRPLQTPRIDKVLEFLRKQLGSKASL